MHYIYSNQSSNNQYKGLGTVQVVLC